MPRKSTKKSSSKSATLITFKYANLNELYVDLIKANGQQNTNYKWACDKEYDNVEAANKGLFESNVELYRKAIQSRKDVQIQVQNKSFQTMDSSGEYFNMDAVLQGDPDCWVTNKTEHENKKVEIFVNVFAPSGVKADKFYERFCEVIATVNEYQKNKVNTKITFIGMAKPTSASNPYLFEVCVKDYKQPVNLANLAHLFCTPYLLRYAMLNVVSLKVDNCGSASSNNEWEQTFAQDKIYFKSLYN